MNIKKIKVGGFRNIANVSLDLSDLMVFISPNGYGKSNLFDAIDFGFRFLSTVDSERELLMQKTVNCPLADIVLGPKYFFEIVAEIVWEGKIYLVQYSFKFRWGVAYTSGAIISEQLNILKEDSEENQNLFSRTGEMAFIPSGQNVYVEPVGFIPSEKNIYVAPCELLISKLLSYDDLEFLPLLKAFHDKNTFFEKVNLKRLQNIQDMELSNNISHLKHVYPDKFEQLENAYMQLFPDVKKVICGNSLLVKKHFLRQPLYFSCLSDGEKKAFLMLVSAVLADTRNLSVLALEEPENSIHPGLLQTFLQVITQLFNGQILISTHSTNLLQYIHPGNLCLGIPNKRNPASFRRISSRKVKKLFQDVEASNLTFGEYMLDQISERPKDLEEYLE